MKGIQRTEKEIDELLQRIKDRTGLTQEQIAQRIGYNRAYLSQAKKRESERLYFILENSFRTELENITSSANATTVLEDPKSQLEQAVLNLSETERINARNIERLITLLEAKMSMQEGPELPTPGTPGTRTLTKKK